MYAKQLRKVYDAMKEFIGIETKFVVDGKAFSAIIVGDTPTFVLVKSKEGTEITRIPKGKISMFTPSREPDVECGLQVLFCENPLMACPGVQLVQASNGVTQKDFQAMNGDCPYKQSSCKCGTKGDIRCVKLSELKVMLAGTLFGEFPKKGLKNG